MPLIRPLFIVLSFALLAGCSTPPPTNSAVADELQAEQLLSADDLQVAVEKLSQELHLSELQAELVLAALDEHTAEFRSLINASYEEEPDPDEMVRLLAEGGDRFNAELERILTAQQMAEAQAHQGRLREAILTASAARRVHIMTPTLELTDEQAAQMAAVVGQSAADLIAVLERFRGRHIGMMQKLELGRAFLTIKSRTDKQLAVILSTEQLNRYDDLRRELAKR